MPLLVKNSGVLDTFQDLGRHGHRRFGINPNGAMDRTSLRVANLLLGNNETETALEFHFPAPKFEFRRRISFAFSGADFCGELDGSPVEGWKTHTAKRGSVLNFKRPVCGTRCYLAVKNGFEITEWLSSGSTNLMASVGGFEGRKLRKGDKIPFTKPDTVNRGIVAGFRTNSASDIELRFVPGPDFNDVTAVSELAMRRASFMISKDSDRMGYRLNGPPMYVLDPTERLSSSVTFGTIQLLPNGQLIMLMADHQTSGGYPNLGTVITPDLPFAAQLGAGDLIRFSTVGVREAEMALIRYEQDFSLLKKGLYFSSK